FNSDLSDGCISDSRHRIFCSFSQSSVLPEVHIDTTHGRSLSHFQGAIISISKFKIKLRTLPGEDNLKLLVPWLDIDEFNLIGAEGCEMHGKPVDLEKDYDVKESIRELFLKVQSEIRNSEKIYDDILMDLDNTLILFTQSVSSQDSQESSKPELSKVIVLSLEQNLTDLTDDDCIIPNDQINLLLGKRTVEPKVDRSIKNLEDKTKHAIVTKPTSLTTQFPSKITTPKTATEIISESVDGVLREFHRIKQNSQSSQKSLTKTDNLESALSFFTQANTQDFVLSQEKDSFIEEDNGFKSQEDESDVDAIPTSMSLHDKDLIEPEIGVMEIGDIIDLADDIDSTPREVWKLENQKQWTLPLMSRGHTPVFTQNTPNIDEALSFSSFQKHLKIRDEEKTSIFQRNISSTFTPIKNCVLSQISEYTLPQQKQSQRNLESSFSTPAPEQINLFSNAQSEPLFLTHDAIDLPSKTSEKVLSSSISSCITWPTTTYALTSVGFALGETQQTDNDENVLPKRQKLREGAEVVGFMPSTLIGFSGLSRLSSESLEDDEELRKKNKVDKGSNGASETIRNTGLTLEEIVYLEVEEDFKMVEENENEKSIKIHEIEHIETGDIKNIQKLDNNENLDSEFPEEVYEKTKDIQNLEDKNEETEVIEKLVKNGGTEKIWIMQNIETKDSIQKEVETSDRENFFDMIKNKNEEMGEIREVRNENKKSEKLRKRDVKISDLVFQKIEESYSEEEKLLKFKENKREDTNTHREENKRKVSHQVEEIGQMGKNQFGGKFQNLEKLRQIDENEDVEMVDVTLSESTDYKDDIQVREALSKWSKSDILNDATQLKRKSPDIELVQNNFSHRLMSVETTDIHKNNIIDWTLSPEIIISDVIASDIAVFNPECDQDELSAQSVQSMESRENTRQSDKIKESMSKDIEASFGTRTIRLVKGIFEKIIFIKIYTYIFFISEEESNFNSENVVKSYIDIDNKFDRPALLRKRPPSNDTIEIVILNDLITRKIVDLGTRKLKYVITGTGRKIDGDTYCRQQDVKKGKKIERVKKIKDRGSKKSPETKVLKKSPDSSDSEYLRSDRYLPMRKQIGNSNQQSILSNKRKIEVVEDSEEEDNDYKRASKLRSTSTPSIGSELLERIMKTSTPVPRIKLLKSYRRAPTDLQKQKVKEDSLRTSYSGLVTPGVAVSKSFEKNSSLNNNSYQSVSLATPNQDQSFKEFSSSNKNFNKHHRIYHHLPNKPYQSAQPQNLQKSHIHVGELSNLASSSPAQIQFPQKLEFPLKAGQPTSKNQSINYLTSATATLHAPRDPRPATQRSTTQTADPLLSLFRLLETSNGNDFNSYRMLLTPSAESMDRGNDHANVNGTLKNEGSLESLRKAFHPFS
ncbi:hypothetical protein HK096_000849, partial [Nowakowskiella sp. JEL0078]